MSCNGCRVLRKGCSDTCILRHCIQWIEGSDAQGHATAFLSKFYGRAGLMSFIRNVQTHERPELFRSLLYDASGRSVNPVDGAVGLLVRGKWTLCEMAVETVLRGGVLKPGFCLDFESGSVTIQPPLPAATKQEKRRSAETAGFGEYKNSGGFKKARMEESSRERSFVYDFDQVRMPSENVESKAPDVNEDSQEVHQQEAWNHEVHESSYNPDILYAVGVAKEDRVEDNRNDRETDQVSSLSARRMWPPVGSPRVRGAAQGRKETASNLERAQLGLDLNVSYNVEAKDQEPSFSPNSPHSVISEGSVSSAGSAIDRSLPKDPNNRVERYPLRCPKFGRALSLLPCS